MNRFGNRTRTKSKQLEKDSKNSLKIRKKEVKPKPPRILTPITTTHIIDVLTYILQGNVVTLRGKEYTTIKEEGGQLPRTCYWDIHRGAWVKRRVSIDSITDLCATLSFAELQAISNKLSY
jgi:hypothetical protein